MNCRLVEQDLSSYLDGELPLARAARLEAHLRTCAHCRQELEAMGGIAGRIRAAGHELQVSTDFDRRVLRAVGYYRITNGVYVRPRTLTKPLVTIALILLAMLGIIRHYFSQPIAPPVRTPEPAAAVVAPASAPGPVPASHDRR